MTIAPPEVVHDPCATFFWDAARRHELHIQRCQRCRAWLHLPRPVCRSCGSFDLQGEPVSGRAKLYSFTTTHKVFHPFFADRVPYTLATVELVDQPGLHLLTRLVDVASPEIGMTLGVTFEALTDDIVIPVFTVAATR
jgi:uncharacterized OB-fold protein